MAVLDKSLDPLKHMLESQGVDVENCWNGNEAVICAAAANCVRCRHFGDCRVALEGACPNIYLVGQLPKRSIH
jgi:hypothetical protein